MTQPRGGGLVLGHFGGQLIGGSFQLGGAGVDRGLQFGGALAFGDLLSPRQPPLAFGAQQRKGRADRDHRRGGAEQRQEQDRLIEARPDRKSTRLNSSH